MMNTLLRQSLANNSEQLKNYISVEITELFHECPSETEILAVEDLLTKYLHLVSNHVK